MPCFATGVAVGQRQRLSRTSVGGYPPRDMTHERAVRSSRWTCTDHLERRVRSKDGTRRQFSSRFGPCFQ